MRRRDGRGRTRWAQEMQTADGPSAAVLHVIVAGAQVTWSSRALGKRHFATTAKSFSPSLPTELSVSSPRQRDYLPIGRFENCSVSRPLQERPSTTAASDQIRSTDPVLVAELVRSLESIFRLYLRGTTFRRRRSGCKLVERPAHYRIY